MRADAAARRVEPATSTAHRAESVSWPPSGSGRRGAGPSHTIRGGRAQHRRPLAPGEQTRQGERPGAHGLGPSPRGHIGAVGGDARHQGQPVGSALVVQVELHEHRVHLAPGALRRAGQRGGEADELLAKAHPDGLGRDAQLGLDRGRPLGVGVGEPKAHARGARC